VKLITRIKLLGQALVGTRVRPIQSILSIDNWGKLCTFPTIEGMNGEIVLYNHLGGRSPSENTANSSGGSPHATCVPECIGMDLGISFVGTYR
jgi:hypothetical protein